MDNQNRRPTSQKYNHINVIYSSRGNIRIDYFLSAKLHNVHMNACTYYHK